MSDPELSRVDLTDEELSDAEGSQRAPHAPVDDLSPSRALAVTAARAAAEKLAEQPVILEVAPVLGIVDHFVVASGRNPRQVKAIVDEVERVVAEESGRRPRAVEGLEGRSWVLLDYGEVVVHVFQAEEREHYRLERLYADVPTVEWA